MVQISVLGPKLKLLSWLHSVIMTLKLKLLAHRKYAVGICSCLSMVLETKCPYIPYLMLI